MDEMDDDPWASLRRASSTPDAGRFAYEDEPTKRAQASFWAWIKLWIKVEIGGWLKKQLPRADKSLDSSYYLGFTRQKKVTKNAVRAVLGKEPEKEISRIPIIILGRRIGTPGLILASFALVLVIHLIRLILNV
jgi:hypothetical protein